MDLLDRLTKANLIACTDCTEATANTWLLYFQVVLPAFGITTNQRLAAFLSQVGVESNSLTTLSENLNYSAEGLANTWPVRYASKSLITKAYIKKLGKYTPNKKAIQLARNPQGIANHCYANRMGNGDETSGDGWKFRGRGLKQLTGRDNYTRASKALGLDLVNNPDLLLEPGYAIISACWFWDYNNLNRFADKQDIVGLTKAINGGTNGLTRRQKLYTKGIASFTKDIK